MIFRLALAGIYIYAGATKVFEPQLFQAVIASFFPVHGLLALALALTLPWVQITAALSLIFNWKTIYASSLLMIMSLFFLSLMVYNYGNVLPFGCGCFGFEEQELVGNFHVLRDFSIFVLSIIVFWQAFSV